MAPNSVAQPQQGAAIALDKYASSINRAFWIVLALCAAAVVVGFGRDEAERYREAADELRSLDRHSIFVNGVYKRVGELTRSDFGVPLVELTATVAASEGVAVAPNLIDSTRYFFIEKGPLQLKLSESPMQVLETVEEVVRAGAYTLNVPAEGNELGDGIRAAMRKDNPPNRTIVGLEFSCNYAHEQCRGELAFKGEVAGESISRTEFYVPSRKVETSIYPFQVLGFADADAARRRLKVTQLRELQDELAGKTRDQAYNYLAERVSEKQGSIKVFDLSFSGIAVFIALPVGILLTLTWLLFHLRELASFRLSPESLRKEAVELFYQDRAAAFAMQVVIALVPVGAMLLLLRVAPKNSPDIVGFLVTAAAISALLSYWILKVRHTIMSTAGDNAADEIPHKPLVLK